MTKFHISDDGNPRACKASKDNCPISADINHYDTAEEARTGYEKLQKFQANRTHTRASSQETRMEKLPEVKGVEYESDFNGEEGVSDAGVKFSSFGAFRKRRNGSRARIASIIVYDDNTAIVWDRTDSNEANIKARERLLKPLAETFEISPYSSPIFRLFKDRSK